MTKYINQKALLTRLESSPIFNNFGEDGQFIKDFIFELIQRQPTTYLDEVRAAAIIEFADRLKGYYSNLKGGTYSSLVAYHIDQIAKEMMVPKDEK